MHKVVFYSWQSDLPNVTNRGFIQDTLEKAAKVIRSDDTIDVEPVIDRDTQGAPGSPDISATIFSKISSADVFVADISIVCQKKGGRSMPNPNVLIELGYALKALGHEKIILLFNLAYGKIEELPFDLRTRRLCTYNVSEKTSDKTSEKNKLQKTLEHAIRAAISFENPASNSALSVVLSSIEDEKKNRIVHLRKFLGEMYCKIVDAEPKIPRNGGTAEDLLASIDKTQDFMVDFSRVVEMIAIMDDEDCALEIVKWIGKIIEKYDIPEGFSGTVYHGDFDYYKFIGHEIYVTLAFFLIKENKWDTLKKFLNEKILIGYHKSGDKIISMIYISSHMYLLAEESKKNNRVSIHADKLQQRHTNSALGEIAPFDDFVSADFFLYLFSVFKKDDKLFYYPWYPRSIIFMKRVPDYIFTASNIAIAKQMLVVFGVTDFILFRNTLKQIIHDAHQLVQRGHWSCPIRDEHVDKIGMQ